MTEHIPEAAGGISWSDIEAIDAASSRKEIEKLTTKVLQQYGMTFVTVWSWSPDNTNVAQGIHLNTRPSFFVERYSRDETYLRDPVILGVCQTFRAVTWSQVMSWPSWSREQRSIVEGGRDFGANDGLTMPVLMQNRIVGMFSVCGWNPDLSPRARLTIKVLGQLVYQALERVSTINARRVAQHLVLNSREREVVGWVARGKVDSEIAATLDIRTTTVKTLLSNAQKKLGVSTRNGIVVRALLAGELCLGTPARGGC